MLPGSPESSFGERKPVSAESPSPIVSTGNAWSACVAVDVTGNI